MFSLTLSINLNPKTIEEQPFMSQLASGFTARSAEKDDIEGLYEIFTEYWETLTGLTKFTLEDFHNIFSVPGFDLETSTIVILTPEFKIVAAGLVMDLGNPPIHPSFFGCVRDGYEARGLGTYLFTWAKNRARQAIERCPETARVSMYLQTAPSHTLTTKLFEELQLKPIRYSWTMLTEFNGATPKPNWPENIRIVTFETFNDLEIILKFVDEAFADHWGHVDRSGDPERIKRFKHQIENDADFDSSIWFLALDGDEIAGVSLCSPKLGADRTIGMVDTLGVRRPWRRQGLGLALLHYSFGMFHQRGYKGVALGVDTQNLSGATRLYKKAGMEVFREFVVYEKELRAGEELGKQE
jgi:mycothiol synthase